MKVIRNKQTGEFWHADSRYWGSLETATRYTPDMLNTTLCFNSGAEWIGDPQPRKIMNEPKPFNLAKAKAGKRLQDRSGREVFFVAYVPEALEAQRVLYRNQLGEVRITDEFGFFAPGGESPHDIMMAHVETRTIWTNVYPEAGKKEGFVASVQLYLTEAEARMNAAEGRVAQQVSFEVEV